MLTIEQDHMERQDFATGGLGDEVDIGDYGIGTAGIDDEGVAGAYTPMVDAVEIQAAQKPNNESEEGTGPQMTETQSDIQNEGK